jgi:hypothetical protein
MMSFGGNCGIVEGDVLLLKRFEWGMIPCGVIYLVCKVRLSDVYKLFSFRSRITGLMTSKVRKCDFFMPLDNA